MHHLPRNGLAMKYPTMPRLVPILVCILLAGCAGDRSGVAVTETTATNGAVNAAPLTPEQVASGLDDLTIRIRERINQTSDSIDAGASNDVRRRTLRFRMRASEVAWRAVQNPNHLAGMIELWLWMAAVDEYAKTDQIRTAIGAERAVVVQELGSQLHQNVESFARRALPPQGFASLKTEIAKAAANGDLLSASPQREQAIIGDLLEVTRLQNVLGLALSPFEALRGIGSGADSVAAMTVTANRAVDLMERYPEIIAWNLRLAVIDMEEQDTAREARAALQLAMKLVDELPARLRSEIAILLQSTGQMQEQSQQTLREVSGAAQALTALNTGVQQTIAQIGTQWPGDRDKPKVEETPGRPFDIREYTEAVKAAESTLREARSAIELAGDKGLPAAQAAAATFEAAADRVLWRIAALLAFAAALAAGLITLHHRLKRRS